MKKIMLLLFYITLLVGCKKDIPEPPTESDSNTSGYATFNEYKITFFNNNFSGSALSVSINGLIGNVTYAYSYNPGCEAIGCANFTLPPGTYAYSYQSNSGNIITSTIITGASQCITVLIN